MGGLADRIFDGHAPGGASQGPSAPGSGLSDRSETRIERRKRLRQSKHRMSPRRPSQLEKRAMISGTIGSHK